MNYMLAVLTHGDGETLERTLDSFIEHVSPAPSSVYMLRDGPGYTYCPWPAVSAGTESELPWAIDQTHVEPIGFCRASAMLWGRAMWANATHVFWLEHDFEFLADIDLEVIARVMAAQSAFSSEPLAQMVFMRDAVNDHEKACGGLYESRPGEYRPEGLWMSHQSYFTTNPSLMSVRFMRDNPWPLYDSECEGRFGLDLLARGYRFGVWGAGEPWVRHIGQRTGKGY